MEFAATRGGTNMGVGAHNQGESDLPPRLSKPAQHALAGAGYYHLEQLAAVHASDIKQLHGIGPNAINQLRAALATKGLSFVGDGQDSVLSSTPLAVDAELD
jgi:hypothetical protein